MGNGKLWDQDEQSPKHHFFHYGKTFSIINFPFAPSGRFGGIENGKWRMENYGGRTRGFGRGLLKSPLMGANARE
jgi:hypothetical protein